jgi:hypothetical protein
MLMAAWIFLALFAVVVACSLGFVFWLVWLCDGSEENGADFD